jgi:signal transduction histidine kinase
VLRPRGRAAYSRGSRPTSLVRGTTGRTARPYAGRMPGPTSRTPSVPVGDRTDGTGWSSDAGFGPPWAGGGPWGPGRPPQVALALVLAVVQVVGSLGAARAQPDRRPLDLLAFVLLLSGPAALALMTRARVPAVTVTVGVATAAYLVLGYPYGPVVLSLVVALVAAVLTGHRLVAWLVAGGVLLAHGLATALDPDRGWSWAAATATLAWALLVLALAEVGRVRRERALSHRRALAEQRRRRAGEDRLRIAQELHDVVAHHMSLINVQASVALHLRGTHPEQVDEALRVIKGASKEALVELRSLIEVLREGDGPAPRHPAASLAALDDLVERTRYAGLDLTTHVTGTPEPLPPGVELAAYRVVQESVTNVVRHSGADRAEITVEHRPGRLVVAVDDDGSGAGDPGALTEGNGIRGMRERAAPLRGEVRLERSPLGGLRVVASFPTAVAP